MSQQQTMPTLAATTEPRAEAPPLREFTWREVLREGVLPLLSGRQLEAARRGLASDDPAMLQGDTTLPSPAHGRGGEPCEGACFLAYACWRGDGLLTVEEVGEAFAVLCSMADLKLCQGGAIRHVLHFFDETARAEAVRLLLAEVEAEAEKREKRSPKGATER
jgi:hypothetical protein